MFCQSCGAQLSDGGSFCNFCGATQNSGHPQPQVQPVYQQAAQSAYQQPLQQNYQQQSFPNYQQSPQPNYQQQGFPNYQQPPQPNYQQQGFPNYQQPYGQPMQMGYNMSREEFFKQFISKKSYGYVTSMAIICFITAALSGVIMAMTGEMLGLLDIAVYVTFGILLLATKHWVCAFVPSLYSAVWTFINLANGGTPTGIVALVVGASCVMVLEKAEKAYKKYRENHIIPDKQI